MSTRIVELRSFVLSECPNLAEQIKTLYTNSNESTSELFLKSVLDTDLKNPIITYTQDGHLLFLALYDGIIAGMVCLSKISDSDFFEVSRLAVSPSYRRKGIGKELMREIMQNNRKIHLSCLGFNRQAIQFYNTIENLRQQKIEEKTSTKANKNYTIVHFCNYDS